MNSTKHFALAALVLLSSAAALRGQETEAAKEYKALLDAYDEEGGVRTFAKRFIIFAELQRDDPTAAKALLWSIRRVKAHADTDTALKLLGRDHFERKSMAAGSAVIANARSVEAEKLLRRLFEKSPHREVRAHAGFHLAMLLDVEALVVEQLKAEPKAAPRLLQYYGKSYGKHLASLKPKELNQAREALNERLLKSYADMKVDDELIGDAAKKKLFLLRHLSVGKTAPEIEGVDVLGVKMKLSDYRGKVVMLSFWGHW